jgi:CHAT domain-containing protein
MQYRPHKFLSFVVVLLLSVFQPSRAWNYSFAQRPENDELFQLVNQIRRLQQEKREKEAIPLVERALAMAERTVPPNDARYIATLITGGEVYWRSGNLEKAEPLLIRAAQLSEKSLDPSHPLYFTSLVDLGLFYREQEAGAKSQPLFEKVVALMEKLRGPEHRDVATYTKLLAESHYQQGDYVHARPLYERTASLLEKLGETNTQAYFATLNDLSATCEATGDYERAATVLSRVIDLKTAAFGANDPRVAVSLRNLGSVAAKTHNYQQAATFFLRALQIYEKATGRDTVEVADLLNQLGLVYTETGDYVHAEPLFKRALAIREQKFGRENRYTSEPLLNLAWIQYARGNYAEAEPGYLRALQILQKTVGENYPELATIYAHLAMLYEAKGDIRKAIAAQTKSGDIAEHNLTVTLTQGTEAQKLLYMNTLRGETYGTISLHLRSAPDSLDAARLALTTILRRKGRLLDVMIGTLGSIRTNIAILEGTKSDSGNGERRAPTEAVTVETVQAALPPQAVLLEFVMYQPFKVEAHDTKAWENPRYAVYLLRHDGNPAWIDLGDAASIDQEVEKFRAALRDPKSSDVKIIGRSLDERIMRRIRAVTGGSNQFLLAPDGQLNLIPFAALVDEHDQYLVENYSISYLTSGRDLLRLKTPPANTGASVIFADPLYDLSRTAERRSPVSRVTSAAPENSNRRSVDFTALNYPPLPGTAEEAAAVKTQVPGLRMFLGDQATEAAVKQVRAPRLLHIATHGFFLPDQVRAPIGPGARQLLRDDAPIAETSNYENPLLRSGLVLAGVKQRSSGANEDGVLTALETAVLDLTGTQLVVLSACDTGLGEVSNGEGVYGLRRSLVLAGSQTQVISLWQVSDLATRDLMAGYYQRLKSGQGRSEALRQTQLTMLRNSTFRHPYFWASFIQSGAWTPLREN